ncbi:hypothetical protein EYF80_053134 [Liparis tanakae]|uniref:Uncharacterized protein n=1 Tax=Liparis tanakae TaxID=230148 RepID=A0A4Z2F6A6_9TELE|nr:hypothetical protein EYF80_053134 [Liparis tanakae]
MSRFLFVFPAAGGGDTWPAAWGTSEDAPVLEGRLNILCYMRPSPWRQSRTPPVPEDQERTLHLKAQARAAQHRHLQA